MQPIIRAVISFLISIPLVGVGYVAFSVVIDNISENAYLAGDSSEAMLSVYSNLANYALTFFSIVIVSALVYILLGGLERKKQCYGDECYEFDQRY